MVEVQEKEKREEAEKHEEVTSAAAPAAAEAIRTTQAKATPPAKTLGSETPRTPKIETPKTTVCQRLFGKWPYEGIEMKDASLAQKISLKPLAWPHTFARHASKQFEKAKVNIVERLANKLMRGGTGEKVGGRVIRTHGRLQGKKVKVLRIIDEAFDAVAARTKENPLQVFVRALEKSAPCEDITRVRFGGISYQVAVDIGALRRLDMTLRNIALAAVMASFDKKMTLAEGLAEEIVLAADGDPNSYAIKQKNNTERMARSAR